MLLRGISATAILCTLSLLCSPMPLMSQKSTPSQQIDSFALQRAHLMLHQIYDEVRKNYYDPTFHGVDLDKSYQQLNARLDSSKSINESYRVIAAFLMNLHDSHTFFMPPPRQNPSTLGFFMQVIGDKCFITRIRPDTDAAAKLHVGDQVLAIHGFLVTPATLHDIEYYVQVLAPEPAETLDLMSPQGVRRQEIIKAKLRKGVAVLDLTDSGNLNHLIHEWEEDDDLGRGRTFETGDTLIWKMPTFEIAPTDMEKAFGKVMKHKNLIIDLRGNSGGYIVTLDQMLGHFFDHELKLADRVVRNQAKSKAKPQTIKPRAPFYNGTVIVLVDHNSASASELFARVIQLEHRGKVIGDRSAGAVMEAGDFGEETGTDYQVYYGLSITNANLLMTDGKSLENVGVAPDELLIPTASDLAAGRDPVLAHAVEVTGAKLDADAAGKLFPFEWPTL